jgi:hypothetical protein
MHLSCGFGCSQTYCTTLKVHFLVKKHIFSSLIQWTKSFSRKYHVGKLSYTLIHNMIIVKDYNNNPVKAQKYKDFVTALS